MVFGFYQKWFFYNFKNLNLIIEKLQKNFYYYKLNSLDFLPSLKLISKNSPFPIEKILIKINVISRKKQPIQSSILTINETALHLPSIEVILFQNYMKKSYNNRLSKKFRMANRR